MLIGKNILNSKLVSFLFSVKILKDHFILYPPRYTIFWYTLRDIMVLLQMVIFSIVTD